MTDYLRTPSDQQAPERATPRTVVGVDVGGTKIRGGFAEGPTWAIDAEVEVATDPAGGATVARQIAEVVRTAAGRRFDEVVAIGVGTPGSVDPDSGYTRRSQNIRDLDRLDLPGRLRQELARPVVFENDANLAAVAEWWCGQGVGCRDVTVISVGTGVGGGSICGGVLLRGSSGGAGELADLPLVGDPFDREGQAQGVFEHQVGTKGMVRRYRETGGPAVRSAREIFVAAEDGDSNAATVIAAVARDVALGIVAVSALLDPQLVVLSGGIGAQPRFVAAVAAALPAATNRPVEVRASALGDRAALLGAVALAAGALDDDGRLVPTFGGGVGVR